MARGNRFASRESPHLLYAICRIGISTIICGILRTEW